MKVLVTGSRGFLAKNLILRLRELKKFEILEFNRENALIDLDDLLKQSDFVFHLAGANRPKDISEFNTDNFDLTSYLCKSIENSGKSIPIVFSSSIQVEKNNPYGESKKKSEERLLELSNKHPVFIYRLPNVFGKWCMPNYNSVVATFCYNLINEIPLIIHDSESSVNLVYVDDVIDSFIALIQKNTAIDEMTSNFFQVLPIYTMSVGELADKLSKIKDSRTNLITEPVGFGIDRALHATYLSYYKPEQFSYQLKRYSDPRGVFVEFLKTKNSGQFSFFTAGPGITRGNHYHHSKTEKFLVLQGKAKFRFRNVCTSEYYEKIVDSDVSTVVETVPGWSHDITNIGVDTMIVMLWANEIFNRERPDTIGYEV